MKDDKNIESLLRNTARQMDEEIDVEEPSLAYFTDLVQKETEAWYKRLWIELALLWVMAVICLGVLAVSMVYAPLVFIGIQVVSVIVLFGYFLKESSRTVAWRS
ncbi:YxlC family protein [Halobacillus sp. K22]|uniref:YxlC family protein n=1 Tax=Halobacillus sp. K22 TaxID=3457431 RepID=UPI003FCC3BFF